MIKPNVLMEWPIFTSFAIYYMAWVSAFSSGTFYTGNLETMKNVPFCFPSPLHLLGLVQQIFVDEDKTLLAIHGETTLNNE